MLEISVVRYLETRSKALHLARRGDTRMTEKDDVLLNSKEVARLLDLSPDTVNEFARKSILPAFKKGRQWRFRRRDVTSFKRQLHGATAA